MEDHLQILRAMLLVGAFVFAGKIFGAIREVVLAAKYGTGEPINTYLFISNLANWPVAVWLSVLMVIAVPLFTQNKASPNEVRQFIFELSGVAIAAGVALAVLFGLGVPLLASAHVLGLAERSIDLVREMVWPLALTLPLGLLIGILSVRLVSVERHINTLLEGVPAIFVIGAVLLSSQAGASPLIWGTLLGFLAQMLVLALFQPWHLGNEPIKFGLQSPLWQQFLKGFGLIAIGQLVVGTTGIVDQVMVAGLGAGSIAILSYAGRILALVIGLGVTAVTRATLPVFSELASGDDARFVRATRYWTVALFLLAVVCLPIAWLLTPFAVRLLFERGAFGSQDTSSVSVVLRYGLLQIPFYFAGIVVVQALAARGRYDRITQVGFVNFGTKILGNWLLIGAFGVAGAMLATAAMYAVALVLLWSLFIRSPRRNDGDKSRAVMETAL